MGYNIDEETFNGYPIFFTYLFKQLVIIIIHRISLVILQFYNYIKLICLSSSNPTDNKLNEMIIKWKDDRGNFIWK